MAKIKTYANDNTINANDKLIGTDFNDSDKTKNYLISELKNYILNGLDVRPYKVYTALLSQTGTNAPVATVLENTLGGDIIWTREEMSVYRGTLIGTFNETKTVGSYFGSPNYYNNYIINTEREADNSIIVNTAFHDTGDKIELSTIGRPLPVEIRVYN